MTTQEKSCSKRWAGASVTICLCGALWYAVNGVNGEDVARQPVQGLASPVENMTRATAAPPVSAASLLGPAPSMLSFQALLTDVDGNPLPGPTVNLEFNIYDGTGALVEGPVLLNDVPITGGVADALVPVSPASFDGSERRLGVTVNPPADELSPRTSLVSVPYAFRVDRVASRELDDQISLGSAPPDAAVSGELSVYGEIAGGFPPGGLTVFLDGNNSRIRTYHDNGAMTSELGGYDRGVLRLFDEGDGQVNTLTVELDATRDNGGAMTLLDTDGNSTIRANGASGTVQAEQSVNIVESIGNTVFASMNRFANGGRFETYDASGQQTVYMGSSAMLPGGVAQFYQGDSDVGVNIFGETGSGSRITVGSSTGVETITLNGDDGDGGARLILREAALATISLDASETPGGGGGISLFNGQGARTMVLDADSLDDSLVLLYDAGGDVAFQLNSENASTAGEFSMYARDANNFLRETVEIVASDDGLGGAQLILRDGITDTIRLDASGGGGGAGVTLSNSAGTSTIIMDADAGDDGMIRMLDANGDIAIEMHADDPNSAGRISMYALDTTGTARETVEIIASEGDDGAGHSNNGAQIRLAKADGEVSITLDAEHSGRGRIIAPIIQATYLVSALQESGILGAVLDGDGSDSDGGGALFMFQSDGTQGLTLDGDSNGSNGGGSLLLFRGDGSQSITLDAEFGAGGPGRIVTPVIEITGGADLSEDFDVAGNSEPGHTVCIDPQNPGKLVVCSVAYDRTVAGVISGANGVHPGMLMGQRGSEADGSLPVALTGRVYVHADATYGAIAPGDLLTTSATRGHVMKVTEHDKARGAIIGKAMSPLERGTGMVLVLVSLQ